MSMIFIGLRSWISAIANIEGGFSAVIRFGPHWARRAADSAPVNPTDESDPNAVTTSAAFRAYGRGAAESVSPGPTATSLPLTLPIFGSPLATMIPAGHGEEGTVPQCSKGEGSLPPFSAMGAASAAPGRVTHRPVADASARLATG